MSALKLTKKELLSLIEVSVGVIESGGYTLHELNTAEINFNGFLKQAGSGELSPREIREFMESKLYKSIVRRKTVIEHINKLALYKRLFKQAE